ncbi:MAG TPA: CDP-alcohol phosphatidyltransferase family protein, partial [Bacteroidota bacterium]|nr:CDP-alcohol phosphatidyltransferase family protein [Bacteroidota bacterium]
QRTPVTPNQLTLLSMVFGVIGGAFLALGTSAGCAAGALFFFLYNVVDCSDGQLARLKHSGTHLGRILDGVADYVTSVAAYVGIGIGYASPSDTPVALWVLTAAAGFSNATQSGLLDFYRNRYLDVTGVRRSAGGEEQRAFRAEYEALRNQRGRLVEKLLVGVYVLYCQIQDRVTGGEREGARAWNADPEGYVRANRVLMRCWTILGPTTQWSLLIVCGLFDRMDIYLWGIAGVGNVLAVILTVAQRWTNARLAVQGG